jgi:betaine reductase
MGQTLQIVHYINQFFGNIGAEDKADTPCQLRSGPVGPGMAFKNIFGDRAEIVATVICGDNFIAENLDDTSMAVAEMVAEHKPDLLLAGPAFGSGRYGMACGAVCKVVERHLGIPVVTGMSEDSPALEIYKAHAYVVPTGKSTAKMREAAQKMAELALCLADGRTPPEGTYYPRGIREVVLLDATAAVRAVDMLVASLTGQPVTTELPLPSFEKVPPVPAITHLFKATIVLITEGGMMPIGNPDKIEMSFATKFGRYSLAGLSAMDAERFTVAHGGYDNSFARADPNRLVPLDVLHDLAIEGVIGTVGEVFYTTAGNGTSVENAIRFGREIAQDIRKTFGDRVGVVLTST